MHLGHPQRRGMADAQHTHKVRELDWLKFGALKGVENRASATEVDFVNV